jgi:hypothetical protein
MAACLVNSTFVDTAKLCFLCNEISRENALLKVMRPVYRKTQGCGLAGEVGQGQPRWIPKFLLRYSVTNIVNFKFIK